MQIPWELWDVLEEAAPVLGYANANQLLIWSGFYSVAIGKPHSVTAPIAAAPVEVQDVFIADLVTAWREGRAQRGSFFEALLADVLARFKLPVGADVVKAVLADVVRNRPSRSQRKGAQKGGSNASA